MSTRLVLMILLLLLFGLSMARTIAFNYLSQPVEVQGPRVAALLRRLLPRLADRAERARTSPRPERLAIERRKTFRSSLEVLLSRNRAILEPGWPVGFIVAFLFLAPGSEVPRWHFAALLGILVLLAIVAIHHTAEELSAELQRVDQQLLRTGAPTQLRPVLGALVEHQVASLGGLGFLLLGPVLAWAVLRNFAISQLTWTILGATAAALFVLAGFHAARVGLVFALEAAETQLTTPPRNPSTATFDRPEAAGTPTTLDSL